MLNNQRSPSLNVVSGLLFRPENPLLSHSINQIIRQNSPAVNYFADQFEYELIILLFSARRVVPAAREPFQFEKKAAASFILAVIYYEENEKICLIMAPVW